MSIVTTEPFRVSYMTNIPDSLAYHTHYEYEIYYFHEGQVSYLINERIYKLVPGDLILMHGMTLHKALIESRDVYKRSIIHFEPSYIAKHIQPSFTSNLLQPFTELKNVHLSLKGDDREECETLFHKLTTLMEKGDSYSYQKSHVVLLELLLFVNHLCQQPMNKKSNHTSTQEKHTQDIITFIEQHYKQALTLDKLQNYLHLNKYYLSKTFKEVTGTTIFQYLLERRIYAAKLLLVDSQASITDICLEVGFKHLAHFSRAFKQTTGLTAEQYRRNHQLMSPKGT